jgi:outer membrane receptor protein involved in Fe transport
MRIFGNLFLLMALLFSEVATAQKSNQALYSISGRVTNAENGTPVAMASFVVNQTIGVITDENGYFRLERLRGGEITYNVSFLGYSPVERKITLNANIEGLKIELSPLSLGLQEVVVTAQSTSAGSTSKIGEEAIRHIQPMSISDMFQLLPGNLSANPSLNSAAQASIREIDSDSNNALGAAVVVDGAPLSNDGNLQALSTSVAGSASNQSLNGMSSQTTAGKGVDLRSVSPDNVESMEVIRGIPSAEYGNLTSGVVIVKTKAGATPWEAKFKADPYSKLVYVGKGFGLQDGSAVNVGIDYSQSYGDTRKHYLGYDRVTATLGYSRGGKLAGRPISMRINGTFYSNINNSKTDPQMEVLNTTYKNKNIGARLNLEGSWKLNGAFISAVDYSFMVSQSYQSDISHDYIASASGAVTNTHTPGVALGVQLPNSYYSDYEIEGKPFNTYLQLKANKIIQLGGGSFTNVRIGADWRYDANYGRGLMFDITLPPQNTSSAALRPRSFRDIPALNNLALFIEDKLNLKMGGTTLALTAGVRLTNMFLDAQANRDDIFVAEPRVNVNYTLFEGATGSLAVTGGWGLSYKAPTLLYLYPDNVYIDRVSLNRISSTDASGSMAVMTTQVLTDTANPDLKPARSRKYEVGVRFRWGGVTGQVTYFREKHTNEFGFSTQPYYMHYNEYTVPTGATDLAFDNGQVSYKLNGETQTAATKQVDYIATYYTPTNRARTEKQGVEYSVDLGQCRPLRTSLIVDGAWFHIRRTDALPYYSKINESYEYLRLMPGGSGTVQDRVNTNFRFITHIPKLKLVVSTTMQVVWYESQQNIWEDGDGNSLVQLSADGKQMVVMPLGFYNRQTEQYTAWDNAYATDNKYKSMVSGALLTAYERETFSPWVMFNFRLTKEIGRMLELSFTANNFTRTSRWHYYDTRTGYKQVYPDMYFGAELKVHIGK